MVETRKGGGGAQPRYQGSAQRWQGENTFFFFFFTFTLVSAYTGALGAFAAKENFSHFSPSGYYNISRFDISFDIENNYNIHVLQFTIF